MPISKSVKKRGPQSSFVKKGVVSDISMSDDGKGSVSIRHGPKPKKDKDGFPSRFPPTTHIDLPNDQLSGLKIGDNVEIGLTPSPNKGSRQSRT